MLKLSWQRYIRKLTTRNGKRVFTGSAWEEKVGYCRALKRGAFIAISGTTAIKDGSVFAPGDPYGQAARCLEIIAAALTELGSTPKDVMRTRMFVTDIRQWEAFGRAHAEFFKGSPPTTSMYEIKGLIHPDLLIEIEADAITEG